MLLNIQHKNQPVAAQAVGWCHMHPQGNLSWHLISANTVATTSRIEADTKQDNTPTSKQKYASATA
jgi:hypothetical protein